LPPGFRLRLSQPRRRRDDVGVADSYSGRAAADAAHPVDGGAAMSFTLTAVQQDYRPRLRRRRLWTRIGSVFLGVALLIWTLVPIYNMLLIALSDDGDEFTGLIWPEDWNWDSFRVVWEEDYWYLDQFWRQLGNSIYMATATMVLTVVIGSLVAF